MLTATQIQPEDDPARDAAEKSENATARELLTAFLSVAALLDATVAGYGLVRLPPGVTDVFAPALDRLSDLHDGVARWVMPGGAAFDRTAATAARSLAARRSVLLRRLTDGLAATANEVLLDGLRRGVPPLAIAERIRRTIGLTAPQARAVANYRMALESGVGHQDRVLRDRRFDASARRVADDAARIERMVERYETRLRAHRARTVARTETLAFANAGRRAAWRQAVERGLVSGNALRRFWQVAGDERTCPTCSAIPGLNAEGVSINGMYDSPIGQVDAPPDPHPGCRCTERFTEVMT